MSCLNFLGTLLFRPFTGAPVAGSSINRDALTALIAAIRAFNRKLHADDRVALSMAIMGDGFALACKL